MMGYTKLFASIVTSTIWREPNEVRLVWITMLALADKNGEVQGSVPGLADMARVSIEACEVALEVLQRPDKYSRTKDFEGCRIRQVEGGWVILNHPKYREMMSKDERREYFRVKKAEQRERDKERATPKKPRQKVSNNVKDSQGQSLTVLDSQQCQHIQKTDTDAKAESRKQSLSEQCEEIYQAYPRKQGKKSALEAIEKALKMAPFEKLLSAAKAYSRSPFVLGEPSMQFIPLPATWFNDQRYDDDPIFWTARQPRNGSGPALDKSKTCGLTHPVPCITIE